MTGLKLNNSELKIVDGIVWQKIFFHDLRCGLAISNEEQALSSSDPCRFSKLGALDNKTKLSDGKFEFLLEYPDRNPLIYFHWKQLNNPVLEEEHSSPTSEGFELIYPSTDSTKFAGLVKTTRRTLQNPLSYLNGVPSLVGSDNFNFAVAIFNGSHYSMNHIDTLYNYPVYDQIGAEICVLWVRVSNILLRKVQHKICFSCRSLLFTLFFFSS